MIVEALTAGAARALSKLEGTRHVPCAVCGFALPKYPGRYPSACPQCDTPIATASRKPDTEEQP